MGMIVVVGSIIGLRLHAFVALLLGAYVVALITPETAIEQFFNETGSSPEDAQRMAEMGIGVRIAAAFGNTTAQIGILIAMAAVIGRCLLESGAAERIVRSILRVTGIEKSGIAFTGSSFILSIPVFFDTVFYLMLPLAKALAMRIGKNYLLLVLAIAAGGTMAHSLVPPTPGPLFLVSEMQIPIHMMMIGGLIVGLFTVSTGYTYAVWANNRWPIPLRDSADAPLEEMKSRTEKDISSLPSLWLSMLPILAPLVFISVRGIIETFMVVDSTNQIWNGFLSALLFFGEKNTALITGGLIALLILAKQKIGKRSEMSESIQEALMSGGVIILITAAGGAFGSMLQQTGISISIAKLTQDYQMALIPLAFFITAVVRTAQGSATVSMITAAGILSGMAATDLDYHHLYLGLAIACGSKPIPWMNDSGFWIICKLSNLTEQETLKTFSTMLTVMGLSGLLFILAAAWIFPLV